MSLDKPSFENLGNSGFNFAIVASRYNKKYVDALVRDTIKRLNALGVDAESIRLIRVPGAGEIPHVCGMLADTCNYNAIIALGVIIKGDTIHDEVIAYSTASALQGISVVSKVPVVNGIISANTEEQAALRCVGKLKRGVEFAETAMEMATTSIDLIEEMLDSEARFEDEEN